MIQQNPAWSLGLCVILSVPALLSGQILLQSMGLLLLATAAGFWIDSRNGRRSSLEQTELQQEFPAMSVGERLLPAIFTLTTIIIIVAAAFATWNAFQAGP